MTVEVKANKRAGRVLAYCPFCARTKWYQLDRPGMSDRIRKTVGYQCTFGRVWLPVMVCREHGYCAEAAPGDSSDG